MFAILETGSKQYKVEEGDVLEVELLDKNKISTADTVNFDSVLLVKDKELHIGQPFVTDARIQAKVLEEFKDQKVIVFKKKAKKQYRRTQGHRQKLHLIQIEKIEIKPPKDVEDVSEKPKPAPKEKQVKTQAREKKETPAAKEKQVKTQAQEKKETPAAKEKQVKTQAQEKKETPAAKEKRVKTQAQEKKKTPAAKEKRVKTQAQEKKKTPAAKEKQVKTQAQEKKQTKTQIKTPKEKLPGKEKEKE